MKRFALRYLIFWLPAVLVAFFFHNQTPLSHILQWFFAFFMLIGWSINTGMAAYYYPKTIIAILFLYTGINIIIITLLYSASASFGPMAYYALETWGGILSYKPLDIFVTALLGFNFPQELYVTIFLVICCFVAYLVAMVFRRIHPNPYSPTIKSR